MGTGKKPDPSRRKTATQHATYLALKAGQKEVAWKAGEVHGVYGHRTHAHQPCVFDVTEGALQCPYCATGLIAEWRGYVPLWDQDWALRYVLVNEEYEATTEATAVGKQVLVLRGKDPKSPLVIREEVTKLRMLPDRAPWNVPVNTLLICLTLWKCDALTRWYRLNRAEELCVGPPEKKPANQPKPPAAPMEKYFKAEEKSKADAADEEMSIGNTMRRLLKPAQGANGKYKPPG